MNDPAASDAHPDRVGLDEGCVPPHEGSIRVRVRYCECDPMGLVHHASYVPWLEMGRTELLRDAGISYRRLEEEGFLLVVVKLDLRFKRPALYDDVVELRTRWTGGSRVKVCHEYELRVFERAQGDVESLRSRGEDLLLSASSTLACVDRSGRPVPLPEWLMSRSERSESGRSG